MEGESLATNASRRALEFRDWPAVLVDLDTLHRDGYQKVGRWDLSQACAHLADWMAYTIDGFPKPPLPMRLLLETIKRLAGPTMLRRALATRSMPSGAPTTPETVHAPGGDEDEAVNRLCATIARFQAHPGPFHPSPIFGGLDRETWARLQLIHCAHHLSFLIPATGD